MKFDEDRVFPRCDGVGYQDADVDRLTVDLFVSCAMNSKAVEAAFGGGVVQWCHSENGGGESVCYR